MACLLHRSLPLHKQSRIARAALGNAKVGGKAAAAAGSSGLYAGIVELQPPGTPKELRVDIADERPHRNHIGQCEENVLNSVLL